MPDALILSSRADECASPTRGNGAGGRVGEASHAPFAFPMRERRITLGHIPLSIVQPADPASLADAIDPDAFAEDERIPYWAVLWPSAVALGRQLVGLDLRGQRVIELGGGLGVASLAAAWAGAQVLLTDYEEEALDFARRNAALNGLTIDCAELDWRDPDWPAGFDWVIASDVLYERRNVAPLAERIPRLLATGGRALIVDPGRSFFGEFIEAIAASELQVSSRPTHLFWEGRAQGFQLVTARKEAAARLANKEIEWSA